MSELSILSWGPPVIGFGGSATLQAPEEIIGTPPASGKKADDLEKTTKTRRQSAGPPTAGDWVIGGGIGAYWGGTPLDSNTLASTGTAMAIAAGRLAGTYFNYRRMRADGIVAIGREIADALVCMNKWSYEGKDDSVDPARVELVKNTWEGYGGNGGAQQGVTLREYILSESCRAKDYGNHTMEIVWGDTPDGGTTVTELLPLLPENTKPLVFENSRTFAGVRNWGLKSGPVDLTPQYCVRFIYDSEGGDLFGRSRMENCKDWIQLKWDIRDKIRTDLNTAIGNTMSIGYPMGTTTALTAENERKAAQIGICLSKGMTVTYPEFSMADQIRLATSNVDASKLSAWKINRLDTGENNFDGFKVAVDLTDEQILFGLLVLPRSVKEAEHGAKADAEQHTISMGTMAWRWISYVVGIVNNITDDILEQNFGKEARGSVRVKAAPISDESIAILKEILKVMLGANPTLALKMLDIKSLLEKLQIKMLPDFDQAMLAQQLAANAAGDVLSSAERLRHMGYDDERIKKIQDEKAEQDAVPADPDGLRRPVKTE
jgi:hypothetical protein